MPGETRCTCCGFINTLIVIRKFWLCETCHKQFCKIDKSIRDQVAEIMASKHVNDKRLVRRAWKEAQEEFVNNVQIEPAGYKMDSIEIDI